ncbi:MAG: RNA polymerase sigma factor [Verrucomicrobiota bacterium]
MTRSSLDLWQALINAYKFAMFCVPFPGVACQMYVVKQMTNIAPSIFHGNGIAPVPPGAGGKIIQRISRSRLSDRVKESLMADADADLVLQSQNGDPAAFEALIRNHQHMVHSLTYRMTGSLADAEDLAQETFIRAYEQIGGFRGTSKFSTWLYRIAVNTCLNWRQSEARRFRMQTNCAEEFAARRADGENPPGDQAGEVQAALLKLPAKQRAAIVLTIYDGLNHAEAARVLGCSETTVSWRVFAAKRKLKRLLTAGRAAPREPLARREQRAEDCALRQP